MTPTLPDVEIQRVGEFPRLTLTVWQVNQAYNLTNGLFDGS